MLASTYGLNSIIAFREATEDTLLHRIIFSRPTTAPSSFATATAELASIADASETWRGRRWSAASPGDRCSPTTGRCG